MFTPVSKIEDKSNLSCAAQSNRKAKKPDNSNIFNNLNIQTKLTVGRPNDEYEQEADRVAGQVIRMPDAESVKRKPRTLPINPLLQRQPIEEEFQAKPLLQMQPIEEEGEERYEAATEETEPATSLSPDAVLPIIYPQLPLFDLNNDMRFKLLFMPPQPDIPALITPFTMRGLLVSDREFNSILQNWNYAYNFYFDLGLDPDSSKWLADKSMSFAYDTQLSLEYPNTIESMEQSGQLPESTTLSVDVFSF